MYENFNDVELRRQLHRASVRDDIVDELLRRSRKRGFDEGFQQAAAVEQQAARRALAGYAMTVLGKDPGDGVIDLGALGKWYGGSQSDPVEYFG